MSSSPIPEFSVVIPVFNEVDNLRPLLDQLAPVLTGMGTHEILFVDDGSTDGSRAVLESLHLEHPNVIKLIVFRRNLGKSAALDVGFHAARGRFIVMMDADLQDQPQEIPRLVEKLQQDKLDVVSGWKQNRQDPLDKTIPSRLFNWSLRKIFKVEVHDFNCGLKVMRAECAQSLILYGQLHRYMLILLANHGFLVGEVPVSHAQRVAGVSKYGWWRFLEGLMDLITIFFLTRYLKSPLYFFGIYALLILLFSVVIGGYFVTLHFQARITGDPAGLLSNHPLWLISPVLFLASLIFFFFGLLGQMMLHFHVNRHAPTHICFTRGLDSSRISPP
ncbi:MAG: glycosyltransferase family 2 protein [Magnetococcus sp. YQC-5]